MPVIKNLLRVSSYTLLSIIGLIISRSFLDFSSMETDRSSLSGFIQILGTLYGIMAAFVVFVVWNRYDKIKETSEMETDSLSELYALVTYLEDENASQKIKKAINDYAEAVIERGWKKLNKGEKSKMADKALRQVYQEIKFIKSERKRFPVIFGQMVEKFEDVADLRTSRVAMSIERLPTSLKTLLLFDSVALIFSVYLFPISNFWLALFITTVIASTVSLTLNVIFDLDNPLKPGEWNLTPRPFEELIKELDERD